MTPADVAYAAAVIDTMGRITTRTVREAELPLLAVSCPNEPLLQWLGDLTGVRPFITKRSYSKHACAVHCPDPHQHIVSVSGRWSLSGAKATVLLLNVRPYLRFQLEAAQQAIDVGLSAGFKPATLEKMRALGWEVDDALARVRGVRAA